MNVYLEQKVVANILLVFSIIQSLAALTVLWAPHPTFPFGVFVANAILFFRLGLYVRRWKPPCSVDGTGFCSQHGRNAKHCPEETNDD